MNDYGTDPLNPDSDGGGVGDAEELTAGTDPLDPSDDDLDEETGEPPMDETGDPDITDEGDDGGSAYGGGCGCQQSSGAPLGFWLLFGALWLRRRSSELQS